MCGAAPPLQLKDAVLTKGGPKAVDTKLRAALERGIHTALRWGGPEHHLLLHCAHLAKVCVGVLCRRIHSVRPAQRRPRLH